MQHESRCCLPIVVDRPCTREWQHLGGPRPIGSGTEDRQADGSEAGDAHYKNELTMLRTQCCDAGMMKTILTIAVALFFFNVGRADIIQVSPGYFAAGVQAAEFEFSAAPEVAGRQRQSNWCWAACVQMVLNFHGLRVAQEQVVERIFGQDVNVAGQPQQILAALSGWAPDVRGRYSAIYASTYVNQGSQIVRDLGSKWPLIIGLRNADGSGHALVLTAVYYSVDAANEPVFDKVVLRDPWPSNPSRQEMTWDEFSQRLMFMARVSVQRL